MKTIEPSQARALLEQGALLVDVRDHDEHAREHIEGACCRPLATIAGQPLPAAPGQAVVFHCASGMRTTGNAALLAGCAGGPAYTMAGGIDGWKRAGLPVVRDARAPLPLMRQVQLGAGTLALAGTVLGATVSPWFHLVSGFVGAGLMLAGATGFCGMARVLALMPWNRRFA
ncbi:rhodanese family protein [Flavobacterium sp. MXW15]|uniref:Rhodanese family protein n=1 Tax=Xanthomonas chitinilytica TaxID=2989819 RepID=A0ABT3JWV0_9XANT|nr:rhodanese family protein [Xanthomonas sp. H13-6]MCW4455751.1 rhodanese family protein [Flavobacterium sp. MXW15]MCW4472967.1 rhodanese family protein [Xanthomonas sp. H13-6]